MIFRALAPLAALALPALGAPTAAAGLRTDVIDFFRDTPGTINASLRFIRPDLQGRRIVETRLHLEFTPGPGYDAGDFFVALAGPIEPNAGADGFFFLTSGDDFGWHGSGTFSVDLTLQQLNGVVLGTLWQFDTFALTDPPILDGFFSEDSRIEIDTIPAVPACPGDVDGDRVVGLADLAGIIDCWDQPGDSFCFNADADHDGSVGLGDVAEVIANWGAECS